MTELCLRPGPVCSSPLTRGFSGLISCLCFLGLHREYQFDPDFSNQDFRRSGNILTQNNRRCPCYFYVVSMEDMPLHYSGFLGGLSSNSLYCLGPNMGLEAQASQSSRLSKAHRAGQGIDASHHQIPSS